MKMIRGEKEEEDCKKRRKNEEGGSEITRKELEKGK